MKLATVAATAAVVIASVGVAGIEDSHAESPGNPNRVVYKYAHGHGVDVPKLIIRGRGCMAAEDRVSLKLIDYDPANDRVVYRCREQ